MVIGSPNYFWNELYGSVAIFANPQIFPYSKRSTKSCVDEPKGNSQFLAMVTQMKYLFFFFHIIQNKFCARHVPCIMHEPWQSLQFCMNFNHLGVVSILFYKCMHLIIHFNPGATRLFLCTFSLSLLFNILTDMPVANSSIDVWHNQEHSQAPFQEFICQHVLPSPCYHELCKHQTIASKQPPVVYRALPWPYYLAPADGQHGQGGQLCRCNVPILKDIK